MVDDILRRRVRRRLNLDPIRATIGTAEGAIYIPGQPGMVWARIRTAEGNFLPPCAVRAGATVNMRPGSPILLRYDEDNQLAINKADFSSQVSAGVNPITTNPLDPYAHGVTNQTEILTLLSHPTTPGTLQAYMKAWPFIVNGTLKIFPGGLTPMLSGSIPVTGSLRGVLFTVKSNLDVGAYFSTIKSSADPLDQDDYQEMLNYAYAEDASNTPGWVYRLADAQTELDDADRWLDLRQLINYSGQSGGSGSGSGDVVGPGSATDNAVARFDLTTGKLIQDSGVIIDDNNNVSGIASIQLNAPNTAILSSDAFTWSQSYTLVAAQSGSADDLNTINGGSTGRLLTIEPNSGNTITVKHNVGNIRLSAGVDCVLTGNMALLLIYDGTYWIDVTFNGVNILTTKGDLLTRTSAAVVRKAVGSNGLGVVARSSVAEGWEWQRRPPPTQPVRLSLSSTIQVTTADVTAATTVYAHPFGGGLIELYDTTDTQWIPIAFASAISVAVPSTLFRLFDVYMYSNSGTATLEVVDWNQTTGSITAASGSGVIIQITSTSHGLSNGDLVGIASMGGNTAANGKTWNVINVAANTFELEGSIGNGTYTSGGTWYKIPNTRATALATQDGRYVKTGDLSRLYLGTGMTTGTSGQSEDSLLNRLLWNNYNRRERKLKAIESATSWSYTTLAFRAYNNSVANRVNFVRGLNEDPVNMRMAGLHAVTGAASGTCGVGIGLDRTTVSHADIMAASNSTNTILTVATAEYKGLPGEGFHFLQMEELSTGAAANFYGDIGDETKYQYGGVGSLMG